MAEEFATEQDINRRIKIMLEAEGFAATAKDIQSVSKTLLELRQSSKKTGKEVGDMHNMFMISIRKHLKEIDKLNKAKDETAKKVKKVSAAFTDFGSSLMKSTNMVGDMIDGLKKLAGISSFAGHVKTAIEYDKALLKVSSATSRLGVGITSLEKKIKKIGISTSLTRMETMSLFSEFEKNQKFASFESFESLLDRIRMMVGSNKEAILELMVPVGSLSQKYSGLAQEINMLGKGGSEADKARLAARLQMLFLTNKIGDTEYRNLVKIINGNKQLSEEDKKAQKAAQDHIKSWQIFKKQVEEVSIGIGQTLLPFLEKAADFLNEMTNNGKDFKAIIITAITALAGVKLGGGILKGVGSKLGSMAVSGAASGGGALLSAGRKGLNNIPSLAKGLFTTLKSPILSLADGMNDLKFGLKGVVSNLGGFKGALGKAGAVAGAAMAGWAAGTAVYNKWVEPALEEKGMSIYDKVMGNDKEETATSKVVGWFAGLGKKKGKQLTTEQKRIQQEQRAAKRGEKSVIEKKAISAEEKKKKLIEDQKKEKEKIAQLEADSLATRQQLSAYAEAVSKLKQSEQALLDAEVERMKLTGDIDMMALQSRKDKVFKTIDAEVGALKDYVSAMKDIQDVQSKGGTGGKTVGEFGKMMGWSEGTVKALSEQSTTMIDIVDTQSKIADSEEKILSKTQERYKVIQSINSAYEGQIRSASLIADEAGLLVQIADSYAIGIGASAQMRMREYEALEKQRASMEAALNLQRQSLMEMEQGDARIAQANQVKETENQILQLQLKQAGITKSLRDGWVEAIGAMNTGAGTFTKIVLDQNKGTAQALSIAGDAAKVSSRSGSLRGGYMTSERFSTQQGVAGQGLSGGGSGRRNFAYQTYGGKMTGSEAEGVQWMARGRAIKDMTRRNVLASRKGLGAAALSGSKHYEGIVGEGGYGGVSMNNASGSINVNVTLSSDAQKTGNDIARAIVPQIQRVFSSVSSGIVDGIKFRR